MDRVLSGLRPFVEADIDKLAALLESAHAWPPASPPNPEDIRARWARWHVDPAHDINVLSGPAGDLVAYSRATLVSDGATRISMELAVDPEWQGRGIGAALYKLVELRARNLHAAHITTPLFLGFGESRLDPVRFLERRNFYPDSSYWQMRIDDLARRPDPWWPENITVRSFQYGERDAERWAELVRLTFRESATGQRVLAQVTEPGSSPEGYFFAVDKTTGLEVGTSRGRIDVQGGQNVGYVGTVGVLPEYRGRGIAQSLVWQTLKYLREQRLESATLFVEANNHNARRLYEWMGWRPVYQTVHYWKNLSSHFWSPD